jgi:hypothetical protein
MQAGTNPTFSLLRFWLSSALFGALNVSWLSQTSYSNRFTDKIFGVFDLELVLAVKSTLV